MVSSRNAFPDPPRNCRQHAHTVRILSALHCRPFDGLLHSGGADGPSSGVFFHERMTGTLLASCTYDGNTNVRFTHQILRSEI